MIKMIIFNGTNKWSDLENWLIGGGGTGGPLPPPLEKSVGLAEQKWELCRTEIEPLQDRSVKIAIKIYILLVF